MSIGDFDIVTILPKVYTWRLVSSTQPAIPPENRKSHFEILVFLHFLGFCENQPWYTYQNPDAAACHIPVFNTKIEKAVRL